MIVLASTHWLTAASAPWWATVSAPVISLLVGQYLTNRSNREQREAEARDRDREREHGREVAQDSLKAELGKARNELESREAQAALARAEGAYVEAVDAIGEMRTQLVGWYPNRVSNLSEAIAKVVTTGNRVARYSGQIEGSFDVVVAALDRIVIRQQQPDVGQAVEALDRYARALRQEMRALGAVRRRGAE